MTAAAISLQFKLVPITCCSCHTAFAMAKDLYELRRKDHEYFYCPKGHSQHFTGTSEAEKLQRQLDIAQQNLVTERSLRADAQRETKYHVRSKRVYRGKLNALKKRVKAGLCPCCHRTFTQLARHIAAKHPNYDADSIEP